MPRAAWRAVCRRAAAAPAHAADATLPNIDIIWQEMTHAAFTDDPRVAR